MKGSGVRIPASALLADLSGLPPLIIQAGTHEVLLDDAVRLAQRPVEADVEVTLGITPGVPHVFQAYHTVLDEARRSRWTAPDDSYPGISRARKPSRDSEGPGANG